MLRVAVANQKGGVGKTASTIGLAGCLVDQGFRVLVVDLEPQATATEWLGARPPATQQELPEDLYGPPLLDALLNGKPLSAFETPSGIDIVPSGNQLGAFEIAAAHIQEGRREFLFRRCLEQLPNLWDVVLIDTPPMLGLLTTNALAAANGLLLPVKLDSASRTPLVRLLTAAEEVFRTLNSELDLVGIVGTFHERRRNHQADVFEWLKAQFAGAEESPPGDEYPMVMPRPIRLCPHVSESHAAHLPVTHYLRARKIRQSIARDDFEAFAAEFVSRARLRTTPSLRSLPVEGAHA